MIFEAFLAIVYILVFAVTSPFRIFGDVELDPEFQAVSNQTADVLASFDFIIPVNIVILILTVLVAFTGSYLLWKGVNWLIRKIPTVS